MFATSNYQLSSFNPDLHINHYSFLATKEIIPIISVIQGNMSHNELLSKKSENSFTKIMFFEIYINIKKELTNRMASETFIFFLCFNINPPYQILTYLKKKLIFLLFFCAINIVHEVKK